MSRDGAGNFSLPYPDFVAGTTIESAQVDANNSDIATALTASLAKDGQTVPTANLPMGGFKHTNVAVASSRTDYARADQVIGSVLDYAADTGTATAYAIAPTPGISAYVVGQRFAFKAGNANSGADPTLAVNSLTAGIVYWPNGASLAAGDIPANAQIVVQVATVTTGTPTFHLQSAIKPPLPRTGGTLTGTLVLSGTTINEAQGDNIASAATTDIGAATGNYVRITGSVTISSFGTAQAGTRRIVEFNSALTLTYNSTSLVLPTGANITTEAGDVAIFVSRGSGNWKCVSYERFSGLPLLSTTLNNTLGSDTAIGSTGTWVTGPTVAQGSTGVWLAWGTVTINAAASSARVSARLTDGTNVVSSTNATWPSAVVPAVVSFSLSGIFTSPPGNIRIQAKNDDSTAGGFVYDQSGEAKDCTLTVLRIA
jgi:hypothetical protein